MKDELLIEDVQRRFTRMIPSVKLLPYEEWLKKTDPVVVRRQKHQSRPYRGIQESTLFMDCYLKDSVPSLNILHMIAQGIGPFPVSNRPADRQSPRGQLLCLGGRWHFSD